MTYESLKAKDVGYQIEMVKDSLKQVQSGAIKVTFTIHPNDMPPELYTDAMGQRYMAVIVPIGDNEEPRDRGITDPCSTPSDQGKGSDSPGRKWNELSYAERAGIRCSDERFHTFLSKDHQTVWLEAANKYINETMGKNKNTLVAGETLRNLCGVGSRKDILPATEAAMIFDDIETQYKMYLKYEEQL